MLKSSLTINQKTLDYKTPNEGFMNLTSINLKNVSLRYSIHKIKNINEPPRSKLRGI